MNNGGHGNLEPPSIDHTIYVNSHLHPILQTERKQLRPTLARQRQANVSKVLSTLEQPSVALGFLGRNALGVEEEPKVRKLRLDFCAILWQNQNQHKSHR
ncbi:MAG: hypothetical protein IPG26_03620 [Coprothermobacter sp.]|nr:hypothetical protein [Coprothermobacter sp.]